MTFMCHVVHFPSASKIKSFCKAECDDSTNPLVPVKHVVISFLTDQLAHVTLLLQETARSCVHPCSSHAKTKIFFRPDAMSSAVVE